MTLVAGSKCTGEYQFRWFRRARSIPARYGPATLWLFLQPLQGLHDKQRPLDKLLEMLGRQLLPGSPADLWQLNGPDNGLDRAIGVVAAGDT